jgi:hypothetical protein
MREVAPADPFRLVAMSSSSVVLVREIPQNITLTELRDIFDQVIPHPFFFRYCDISYVSLKGWDDPKLLYL